MPLSERERRILEDIEKGLYEEDPGFAREVRREAPRMAERRRVQMGAILVGAGLAILIAFFLTGGVLLLGVAAFAAMVGGVVMIAGSFKGFVAPRRPSSPPFADRFNQAARSWEDKLRQRYRK
jgi:predicted phage tail protein